MLGKVIVVGRMKLVMVELVVVELVRRAGESKVRAEVRRWVTGIDVVSQTFSVSIARN